MCAWITLIKKFNITSHYHIIFCIWNLLKRPQHVIHKKIRIDVQAYHTLWAQVEFLFFPIVTLWNSSKWTVIQQTIIPWPITLEGVTLFIASISDRAILSQIKEIVIEFWATFLRNYQYVIYFIILKWKLLFFQVSSPLLLSLHLLLSLSYFDRVYSNFWQNYFKAMTTNLSYLAFFFGQGILPNYNLLVNNRGFPIWLFG